MKKLLYTQDICKALFMSKIHSDAKIKNSCTINSMETNSYYECNFHANYVFSKANTALQLYAVYYTMQLHSVMSCRVLWECSHPNEIDHWCICICRLRRTSLMLSTKSVNAILLTWFLSSNNIKIFTFSCIKQSPAIIAQWPTKFQPITRFHPREQLFTYVLPDTPQECQ